jgi:hypothetical protein
VVVLVAMVMIVLVVLVVLVWGIVHKTKTVLATHHRCARTVPVLTSSRSRTTLAITTSKIMVICNSLKRQHQHAANTSHAEECDAGKGHLYFVILANFAIVQNAIFCSYMTSPESVQHFYPGRPVLEAQP